LLQKLHVQTGAATVIEDSVGLSDIEAVQHPHPVLIPGSFVKIQLLRLDRILGIEMPEVGIFRTVDRPAICAAPHRKQALLIASDVAMDPGNVGCSRKRAGWTAEDAGYTRRHPFVLLTDLPL
jgi:hypothetical protein